MGKAGYKKFKKQEKAKVKLKGNKTLLPKGQNVTDTTFKVKKIIVKEQLKEHSENEILTKKHLSIKELISRLGHYNVGARQDALNGLKELFTNFGTDIILANLSPLLKATMILMIDKESDVRTDTLKLLSLIFDKVTEKELSPLIPMVIAHLTCAMTHIESGVRADSLRLLDIMLATLPSLTVAHTATLMPHFLDLISERSESGGGQSRTLSLHLDGRITSEKWRGRVIGRLNRLVSVISEHSKKNQMQTVRSVEWRADQHIHLGLYNPVTTSQKKVENIANLPIQEYTKILMPLLLDTFIEAVPKQDQDDSQSACVVQVEVAALLQSIVDIIINIWHLLKQSSQSDSLTDWFRKSWGDSVASRILRGRFPYSISTATSRKRKRDTDQFMATLELSQDRDPSGSLLNLKLCLLAFLLTQPGDLWSQSIQHIKRSLRFGGSLRLDESVVLIACLEASSDQPMPPDTPSLLSVMSRSNFLNSTDNQYVNRMAFDFLINIATRPAHHLHQDKYFTSWLDSLPALLCKPTVYLSTVTGIAAIAARNFPAFSNSLDGWIEEILGNLAALKVIEWKGERDEGRKYIINLVYWVSDWDQGVVQTVHQLIEKGTLGLELTNHLVDIIRLKAENTEDLKLKEMLEAVLPQRL